MTPNPEIPRVQVAGNPGRTLRRVWLLAALVKETGKPNARLRLRHERGKREALLPLPALPHPRLAGNRARSTNASERSPELRRDAFAGKSDLRPRGRRPTGSPGGGPTKSHAGDPRDSARAGGSRRSEASERQGGAVVGAAVCPAKPASPWDGRPSVQVQPRTGSERPIGPPRDGVARRL